MLSTHLDENTHWLREYSREQDRLEEQYLHSLDSKKEEIEIFANEILKGYCDCDTFFQAFSEYWDDDKQEYSPFLTATLDDWNLLELQEEDIMLMQTFSRLALETACEIIMGDSLYSVSHDGAWSVNRMINDLVGEA